MQNCSALEVLIRLLIQHRATLFWKRREQNFYGMNKNYFTVLNLFGASVCINSLETLELENLTVRCGHKNLFNGISRAMHSFVMRSNIGVKVNFCVCIFSSLGRYWSRESIFVHICSYLYLYTIISLTHFNFLLKMGIFS